MENKLNLAEIEALYHLPFLELLHEAQVVHKKHFTLGEVQVSHLVSVKTGGCPEDCHYCPQAARYQTGLQRQGLMPKEDLKVRAREAKASGASRLCLGAAWREVRDGPDFDHVVELVETVAAEGLEVCCTLGMLSASQARRLKEAGLHSYNHNIDTSEAHYGQVITTRSFQDRIETLGEVRAAGISVCSGGILGLGESAGDRLQMLLTLARLNPQPESVPINTLIPVAGTPLAHAPPVPIDELVRIIAVARIIMPKSFIRLSAGRLGRSMAEQALCFLAGANSIFHGEKLLTAENPSPSDDDNLFRQLGLTALTPAGRT